MSKQLLILHEEPNFVEPVSQLCTQAQFNTEEYQHWCKQIREQPRLHRKQWEFCYILQALSRYGMLQFDKKGLGFGVGKEPIPGVLAKYGCNVLATDLQLEQAKSTGWVNTNQHAINVSDLNIRGICDTEQFLAKVQFREMDMNHISEDLVDFDFTWSSCAFEHLGSIEKGLNFVKNTLKTLKPGGVAIHTTEFNVSSDEETPDNIGTVLFRKQDIIKLATEIVNEGHHLVLNFNPGSGEIDQYIDVPPYKPEKHLKLRVHLNKYITTSIGLIIHKKMNVESDHQIFIKNNQTEQNIKMSNQLLIIDKEPNFVEPVSQLCTQAQFNTEEYQHWCKQIREQPRLHRKQWEFCYILQALSRYGMLQFDKKGLGFGVGKEPIPGVLAKYGCNVLATDLQLEQAKSTGWVNTNQHAINVSDLNIRGICDTEQFLAKVQFREMDMNHISEDLVDFDFTWSSCAFEHLGSIEKGLNFVKNTLKTLKPGGVAIHTTEFNVSSDEETPDNIGTVLFRKQDIIKLATEIVNEGHHLVLNFNPGSGEIDQYIDVPPYKPEKHLKLRVHLNKYITTSIGLIIHKKQ